MSKRCPQRTGLHIKWPDLSGKRFGRLVAQWPAGRAGRTNKQVHWLCLCDCGNLSVIRAASLTSKKRPTLACGCRQRSLRTVAQREKIRIAKLRDKNPNWKGNTAKPATGRMRANMWFKAGPCSKCSNPKGEHHHKDENPLNNEPANIEILCRKCHMEVHKALRENKNAI